MAGAAFCGVTLVGLVISLILLKHLGRYSIYIYLSTYNNIAEIDSLVCKQLYF